jgi:hypothetical protein
MPVVLLAGLTIATPACRVTENQETALGDGGVAPDAAEGTDMSISPEASIKPDGDEPPSDVDGSADDAPHVPGADGGGSAGDAIFDVEIEDTATDSADPTDAGTKDSDAAVPDADAAVPTGREPIDPLFPTCAHSPSSQRTPYAIIDASLAPTFFVECSCTHNSYARTYRVLCGSYTPPAILNFGACPGIRPSAPREIYIVSEGGCWRHGDAGTGVWVDGIRPLSDWDTLLAEQITGHADSGGRD